MYKNVGKKIMVLAQVCGWVCLIAECTEGRSDTYAVLC